MKIQKQYLLFKNKNSYDEAVYRDEIKPEHIAFLKEEGVIMTHGCMFGGEGTHAKGVYGSVDKLPEGKEGDWAIVKDGDNWYIYTYNTENTTVENITWVKNDVYEFPEINAPIDFDDVYVRKDSLANFLKNINKDYITFELFLEYMTDYSPVIQSLVNYYTKNEINSKFYSKDDIHSGFYSKDLSDARYSTLELLRLISSLLEVKVVDQLPETPDKKTLYLVRDSENSMLFTWYIYNTNDGWVELGQKELEVDLSGYATIDYVSSILNTRLQNYITALLQSDVLDNYYTKEQVDSLLKNQGSGSGLDTEHGEDAPQIKHIIIEQASYEALETYEDNAIYFVLEPQTQTNWTFGGTFPITFAADDSIGTFPINLS